MANNQELLAEAIQFMELEKGFEHYVDEIFEAYQQGQLLTFAEWKKLGYSVKKGQKSPFSCKLWKKLSKAELEKAKKKLEEKAKAEGKEKAEKPKQFVMTKCCFFLPSQVEKIQMKKAV